MPIQQMIDTQKLGFSLIPGPEQIESPCYSTEIQEFVTYKPQAIAAAFTTLPGFEVIQSAHPSWWEWHGVWRIDGQEIHINMTCMGEHDDIWGGSELSGTCRIDQILQLWRHLIASGFSAVYLHNSDCRLFTLAEFEAEISN